MYLLETKKLVKSYKKRRVVNNVNINIKRGEIVGLLGPNGAGKTTIFYMIVGLIRPEKGQVIFVTSIGDPLAKFLAIQSLVTHISL